MSVRSPVFAMTVSGPPEAREVRFAGPMTAATLVEDWKTAVAAVAGPGKHRIDLSAVDYLDGAGAGLLLEMRRVSAGSVEWINTPTALQPLLEPMEHFKLPKDFSPPRKRTPFVSRLGELTVGLLRDLRAMIAFVGELLVLLLRTLRHPRFVRWREVWVTFRKVGVDAVVIVGLIGFLMGMILAFQSAAPLQQFGVDIFVVNLVTLAMLRELGVIMTAIVLAGRSGSAFAAEIGTMKVNEEINALRTMGLDPARFLVLPRVLAGMCAMPLLTIYANVVGILGGLIVVTTFGHTWSAVWTQLLGSATVSDVATGMIKSVFFGFLVSSIGCLRGLQTQAGALAVGVSTTRAVVASIILIIFTDMIFAVVFYAIGF
jgi:phospholipid/cholesterol/gamma-HCH transport system permease protein